MQDLDEEDFDMSVVAAGEINDGGEAADTSDELVDLATEDEWLRRACPEGQCRARGDVCEDEEGARYDGSASSHMASSGPAAATLALRRFGVACLRYHRALHLDHPAWSRAVVILHNDTAAGFRDGGEGAAAGATVRRRKNASGMEADEGEEEEKDAVAGDAHGDEAGQIGDGSDVLAFMRAEGLECAEPVTAALLSDAGALAILDSASCDTVCCRVGRIHNSSHMAHLNMLTRMVIAQSAR